MLFFVCRVNLNLKISEIIQHVHTITQFTQIPVTSPSQMPTLAINSLSHFIPGTACNQTIRPVVLHVLERAGTIHGKYLNELLLLPLFMQSLHLFFFAVASLVGSAVCLGKSVTSPLSLSILNSTTMSHNLSPTERKTIQT